MVRDDAADEINWFVHRKRDAFESLVLRHRKAAVRFAVQSTGDYYTAEDLVQDCFAYVYVYPDKFTFRASFQTYLFTLIRYKSVDNWRRTSRTALVGDQAMNELRRDGGEPGPEEWIMLREVERELELRLRALKEDYRLAVYLVDLEEWGYREAAAVMGKSPVAFKIMLHRARKQLKQAYLREGDTDGNGADAAGAGIST